jgi:hypothetical protein
MFRFIISSISVFVLLFSVSTAFAQQNVFVLGSFGSLRAADSEADRLRAGLGLELSIEEAEVNGNPRYRILVSYEQDPVFERELTRNLASFGVSGFWKVTRNEYDSVAPSEQKSIEEKKAWNGVADGWAIIEDRDIFPKKFYVVAGSYRDKQKAAKFAKHLGDLGQDVKLEPSDIFGTVYHRVLVGPVYKEGASAVKQELLDHGVASPWLVSADESYGSTEVEYSEDPVIERALNESEQVVLGLEEVVRAVPEESGKPLPDGNDFNLARLKKN